MKKRAFTLVEILVVVTIIAILSTIVVISLSNTRSKARDAKRASDVKTLGTAIELYRVDNDAYPAYKSGCPAGSIWSADSSNANAVPAECAGGTWIQGLAPGYLSSLPKDPGPQLSGRSYYYVNKTNCYKVFSHDPEDWSRASDLIDPRRDGGAENPAGYAAVDGSAGWSWARYSAGCEAN